jgi:hypothetical protein
MKSLQVSALLCVVLGLAGCAGYKARPLVKLNTGVRPGSKDTSVSFAYHVFDKRDCKQYLDRDVIEQGYQPIHITLTNNSSRRLNLDTDSFSVAVVSPDEIAKKVHTSTAARAAGYGIPGLFFWPLLIPAVIDSVNSAEANKQLDADFDQKTVHNQEIAPYSSINGLIFVPTENFTTAFDFSVIDVETGQRFVLSTNRVTLTV